MYVQVFEEEICYYYVYECLFQEEYLEGGRYDYFCYYLYNEVYEIWMIQGVCNCYDYFLWILWQIGKSLIFYRQYLIWIQFFLVYVLLLINFCWFLRQFFV